MSDKDKNVLQEGENPGEDMVVIMTDEAGNEYYYEEEMIIPVGDDRYALLVGLHGDGEEHGEGCGCGCEDGDEDVIIAKIVKNEDGEEEYVEPTDEEFEMVQKAYDALVEEEEEDSKE